MRILTLVARPCAVACLAWTCFLPSHIAQAQEEVVSIDTAIEASLAKQEFMGSVLVAKGDKIVLSKAYGYANLEWKISNSTDTKFRIGSLTKQFTAAAILLLEELGQLNLHDPIQKFMPDAPAEWKNVTLFHLLTHTSGIANYTSGDFRTFKLRRHSPPELMARFHDFVLGFEPGQQFVYSNSGYALLGYAIEQVSGKLYGEFLQENIFAPLAMHDSGYDVSEEITPKRASGYALPGDNLMNAAYVDMSNYYSAGGLYSTTGDLLRWQLGLFGGKLLSATSLKKMTTPYMNNYALGIGVRAFMGHPLFGHHGALEGFRSVMDYFPETKLTVIVLGNVENDAADNLATKIEVMEFARAQ